MEYKKMTCPDCGEEYEINQDGEIEETCDTCGAELEDGWHGYKTQNGHIT